ncbi:hypothetical protein GCM10027169_20820 [Gordonia jinhuaensis]|uniref:Solute-binding protein family 5 domain-containing protein n=1 Tax=Gordonia jinhuaensis TaxID=1517702 RepID=A0A916TG55_9ACTN|nr:hypothetical protein GCM10011489_33930 [Gordonia jinhuaensis]
MELGSDADAFKTAKTIADVDLRQSAGFQWRHLDFNGAKGRITADPAVRVAIQKGINRDLIAKALLGQITSKPSVLNNHMFIDGQDGFQANNGDITYNPDEAKKELDAAGWTMSGQFRKKDGKQLDLHDVLPSGTPNASQEAQIIQQNLKEIGVNLIIDTVPSDDFFEKHVQVGDFDVTQFTWEDTVFPGSAQSIYSLTPGNIQQNYGQIGSDEINNLLNEMVTTTDPTKRNQIANQADEAIWKIGFSLPLYQRPYTYATKKALANFGAPGFGDTDMTKVGWLK